jgi:hypothetical protein
VRLRQVMSNLEATYSRDTILLIFPDGTGPALLSAMIAGIPYNRVHELEFAPGELRLDVTYESILALWKTKQNDPAYAAVLEQGRAKLAKLRSTTDIVSLKDEMVENERLAVEVAFREKQTKRQQEEEAERRRRLQERQEQIITSDRSMENDSLSPGVLAAAGLSVAGVGLMIEMTSQDKDNVTTDDLSKISPTGTSNTTSLGMTVLPIDLSSSLPSLSPPSGSNVPGPPKMRVNGDSGGTLPTVTMSADAKYELAQQAMHEYMERDDGADAWLNSIAEIAAEGEEDKDKDIQKAVK